MKLQALVNAKRGCRLRPCFGPLLWAVGGCSWVWQLTTAAVAMLVHVAARPGVSAAGISSGCARATVCHVGDLVGPGF